MDVPAQISPSLVRSAGLPPILPIIFSSKRKPAIISFWRSLYVILLPLTMWIKQIFLVILAGQRGCENPLFLENVIMKGGREGKGI